MPDLNYGYEVTIAQNATFDPSGSPIENQWQRKLPGNTNWESISGATQNTLTVTKENRGAKIRLRQSLNGGNAVSNELQVTSDLPQDFNGQWVKSPYTYNVDSTKQKGFSFYTAHNDDFWVIPSMDGKLLVFGEVPEYEWSSATVITIPGLVGGSEFGHFDIAWNQVGYNDGTWLAVGMGGKIARNTGNPSDRHSWVTHDAPWGNSSFRGYHSKLNYVDGEWITMIWDDSTQLTFDIWKSVDDGITWSFVQNLPYSHYSHSVALYKGMWYMSAKQMQGGTAVILRSATPDFLDYEIIPATPAPDPFKHTENADHPCVVNDEILWMQWGWKSLVDGADIQDKNPRWNGASMDYSRMPMAWDDLYNRDNRVLGYPYLAGDLTFIFDNTGNWASSIDGITWYQNRQKPGTEMISALAAYTLDFVYWKGKYIMKYPHGSGADRKISFAIRGEKP